MMNRTFTEFEVLPVNVASPGTDFGLIPRQILMVVEYYQVDENYKQLVRVALDYDDMYNLDPAELSGETQVHYNLTFSLVALSHKDLTVTFSFKSYFYMILYLLIGILSCIVMAIFALYHRIAARPHRGVIAPFKFISYYKLTIPTASSGVGLGLVPVVLIDLIIALFVTGKLFSIDASLFDCEFAKIESCVLTLFDLVKDDPDNISVNYGQLRTGRCGVAMLMSGVYLMFVGLSILIPDTSDKRRIAESYDGNIWEYYQWKRSNMIFFSIWMIFIMLIIIQFSFSDTFGDFIWYAIVALKLVGVVID